ncbi:tubulinyl-Tyr carboxypeptidase 1 [Hyperolius riggenbachi]|uniref:tubulinyl-Tyr carboxypeptidase 1 n=1 Tax=Hyperolius riggenbachi TaxID=752182 RepID=UPI0035A36692
MYNLSVTSDGSSYKPETGSFDVGVGGVMRRLVAGRLRPPRVIGRRAGCGRAAPDCWGPGMEEDDGGTPFYINRGGLPIQEEVWERMWRYVARIHPGGEQTVRLIRARDDLPRIPIPAVPVFSAGSSVPERVEAVQRYIRELQYNHTGTQFFEIKKTRPLTGLMDLAKEMTKEALPIKCLEAVILAIYLTNSISGLERFPISFKTQFSGGCFRHIVLGLHWNGYFGAVGISRREDLMYKPFRHRTLSDLIADFQDAYSGCWHTLRKVKIGPFVSHDPHSVEQIDWKQLVLDVQEVSGEVLRRELERHSREMRLRITKGPPSPPKERKRDVTPSPQRGQSSPQRRERQDRRSSGDKPCDPKSLTDLSGYQIRV